MTKILTIEEVRSKQIKLLEESGLIPVINNLMVPGYKSDSNHILLGKCDIEREYSKAAELNISIAKEVVEFHFNALLNYLSNSGYKVEHSVGDQCIWLYPKEND